MAQRRRKLKKLNKGKLRATKAGPARSIKIKHEKQGFVTTEDNRDYQLVPEGARITRKKPAQPILNRVHNDPVRTVPANVYVDPAQEEPQYRTGFYKHKVANDAARRKVYRSRFAGPFESQSATSHYRDRDKWYPMPDSRELTW
jgi:hypothetical protein